MAEAGAQVSAAIEKRGDENTCAAFDVALDQT